MAAAVDPAGGADLEEVGRHLPLEVLPGRAEFGSVEDRLSNGELIENGAERRVGGRDVLAARHLPMLAAPRGRVSTFPRRERPAATPTSTMWIEGGLVAFTG